MSFTRAGPLISSASTTPSFSIEAVECFDDFVPEVLPAAVGAMAPATLSSIMEAAPKQPIPFLWVMISEVNTVLGNTYCDVIYGADHVVTITHFGRVGEDLQKGDVVLFINLYPNLWGGKAGVKFGNRTAYFKTSLEVCFFFILCLL